MTNSSQNHIWTSYIAKVDYLQYQFWISVKCQSGFFKGDNTKPFMIFQTTNFFGFFMYRIIMVFESIKIGSK